MISGLFVVAHVLAVFALVGGIVGRDVCAWHARRATDLKMLAATMSVGSVFEQTLVRPATFAVLVTGLLAAWQRGWPILGALQGHGPNWVLAALLIYLSIVPVIVFVFIPRGVAYRKALTDAEARGQVTPELSGALRDPAVTWARRYELAMVVALVYLMVLRPF